MPTNHAVLSASASERWLHCTPSARLGEAYEDKDSDYAAEGSNAHELCEFRLKEALGIEAQNPIENLTWYNEEMEECARNYASYVIEQLELARQTCSDPVVMIEQRVDFSRWVQEGFGTADCIIIADGVMKCAFAVNEDDLEGRVCYGGLDLSSTTDITAFVLVFPPLDEDDKYMVLPYFWIPEDNIDLRVRRDHVPYDVWERQGYLFTTEGNVVHYGFIEKFIEQLGERYNIREIAFDRWGAVQMVQNLEGMGFTVVPFGQGFKDMSPPTKELMKLVLEEKIAHGGHPILHWMMDNIFIRSDPAGNIKADKEKSTEKIDGAIATIMALDRAIRCGNNTDASVYDDRGILFI